jgi:hypothetical protein
MAYWHGGGRIDGPLVLPGNETGRSRSGDVGVFVTIDRSLAETYASTVSGPAWVYEVEPLGGLEPIPSLVGGPTISFRCERARIIRRFTVSNAVRAAIQRAVLAAERWSR